MTKIRYYIFLANSSIAMELYQLMNNVGIESTLAPTPREADHCCGVSIVYKDNNKKDDIKKLAQENNIIIDDFWEIEIKDDPSRFKFC